MVINTLKVLLGFPQKVHATTIIDMGKNTPPPTDITVISLIINNSQKIVSAVAGVVAVGVFLFGAFLYMTAGGDEKRAETAKKYLTYGLIGMFLILGAQVLISAYINILGGKVTP